MLPLSVRRIIVATFAVIFIATACGTQAPSATATAQPTLALPTQATSVPPVPTTTALFIPTVTATLPADPSLMTQDQLICTGTKAPPCEDRKIRIRGFDNPTSQGAPVIGQSYGWFPKQEGIPWIIVSHEGVGPQGHTVGSAFDAGTLMQLVKEDNEFYYVRHPDHPADILFTLKKSEVTSSAKPSASFYMKPVTAKWCPAQPKGRWSAVVGETYTWYSIGYGVQFSMLQWYANAQTLMDAGIAPEPHKDNGIIVVRQDFEPYTLMKVIEGQGVWLKDANGVLFWAPNMFCDYWPDVQP